MKGRKEVRRSELPTSKKWVTVRCMARQVSVQSTVERSVSASEGVACVWPLEKKGKRGSSRTRPSSSRPGQSRRSARASQCGACAPSPSTSECCISFAPAGGSASVGTATTATPGTMRCVTAYPAFFWSSTEKALNREELSSRSGSFRVVASRRWRASSKQRQPLKTRAASSPSRPKPATAATSRSLLERRSRSSVASDSANDLTLRRSVSLCEGSTRSAAASKTAKNGVFSSSAVTSRVSGNSTPTFRSRPRGARLVARAVTTPSSSTSRSARQSCSKKTSMRRQVSPGPWKVSASSLT
mmetsp:Transcript_24422/g.75419  ORF Transcript_24422/g.75419 Transcript_24422/m.75419 type:complete len:300 (-) Transcript_24422:233-1132(-)